MFPGLAGIAGFSSSATGDATDPNFSSVKLLVGFDGSNGATSFTDESSNARTLTTVGNAQITTTSPKYGTGSGLFDGSGDRITAPDSADWDFGTGDFTVEGWFWFTTKTDSQAMLGQWDDAGVTANCAWYLYINGGNLTFTATVSGGGANESKAVFTPALGQWYHIAATRESLTYKVWLDGSLHSSLSGIVQAPNNSTAKLILGTIGETGTFSSFDFNGKMDEVRITKGVARYTSTFTPSTAAFPRS